jgi:hypothetical protein
MSSFWGRSSRRTGALAALVAAALAALVLAAPAGAEVRSGSATDGVESERLPPGLDIVAASASYDTAGTIVSAITTAGPLKHTEEALLTARVGVLSGSECVAPLTAIVGTLSTTPVVAWASDAAKGEGTETVAGNVTTLTVTSPALANQPFNCIEPAFHTVEGENLGPVLEGLTAPIQLAAPPPPAPPASTPPASSSPPPAPTPPAPPKVANLTIPSQTLTLHRGAWKQVKLKIANTGNAAAAKVTVSLGKAKGVVVKPRSGKLKLKSIAAGKSKTAAFKVALTPKAKGVSKLAVTVKGAKGVNVAGSLTLNAWKKPTKSKKGKGPGKKEAPPPANPPLAEKIFYGYQMESMHSATLIGYSFIDGEWAYHGVPTEGFPQCTSVTGDAEHSGCVKYTYDPSTQAVQIGSLSGKLNGSGSLEVDGKTYEQAIVQPAGTRLQVEQEFIGYSGLCGLITGCTTWHEHLILGSNGEFVLSRESLSTLGGIGPGETFVAAGSYPADQHGTYQVESGARIKLSFADGTTSLRTFAVFLNKEGKPDPTYAGILLGTDYFTFAHDE